MLGRQLTSSMKCTAMHYLGVADWYHLDTRIDENGDEVEIDDVEVISSIASSGNHDPVSGLTIIDDDSIPEWLYAQKR